MNLRILLIYFLFVFGDFAFADKIPLIVLSGEKSVFSTEGYVGVYADESQFMSIEQLYNKDSDSLFKLVQNKQLNFGYTSASVWCQIKLKNEINSKWFLKVGHPLVDHLDVYLIDDSSGKILETIKSGALHQSKRVTYCLSGFLFKLPLKENQVYRLFIRMESRNILIPMLEIGTRIIFIQRNCRRYS